MFACYPLLRAHVIGMAPSAAPKTAPDEEECICLLEECVCGLTRGADVPGAHDPLILAPKAVTLAGSRAGKPVEVTLSDAASTSTAAAESSFDEVGQTLVDGVEDATAAKGRTGLSLLGKSWWRPEAPGVQEELAAPDLKVQLDAAAKQEYARLKALGPRGRKDAKALQHTPPTVDKLPLNPSPEPQPQPERSRALSTARARARSRSSARAPALGSTQVDA